MNQDKEIHIRLSNLLKFEIEQAIFDNYWNGNGDINMTASTFIRSAIIREIKRIKRNNKNKEK